MTKILSTVVAVLLLAGCGGSSSASGPTTTAPDELAAAAGSEPAGLTDPCSHPAEININKILAALDGEPAPTLAGAQTAAFTVGGDDGRIVVARLVGPGVGRGGEGAVAIFAIGPSGTMYAADGYAKAFSTLEPISLNAVWDDAIEYVEGCLAGS